MVDINEDWGAVNFLLMNLQLVLYVEKTLSGKDSRNI
jgi:hypothetical protein